MATVDQPELESGGHSSSKSTSTPVSPTIPENEDIDTLQITPSSQQNIKSIDRGSLKHSPIHSMSSIPSFASSTIPEPTLTRNFSNDDNISVISSHTVSTTVHTSQENGRRSKKKVRSKPGSTRVSSRNKMDSSHSSSNNKHNKYYRNLKNRHRSSSNKNDIEIHAKRRYKLDDDRIGICQFIGQTSFAKGIWVGMKIENGKGNTNGTVYGRKYFTCREGKGLFVRPNKIIEALDRFVLLSIFIIIFIIMTVSVMDITSISIWRY